MKHTNIYMYMYIYIYIYIYIYMYIYMYNINMYNSGSRSIQPTYFLDLEKEKYSLSIVIIKAPYMSLKQESLNIVVYKDDIKDRDLRYSSFCSAHIVQRYQDY